MKNYLMDWACSSDKKIKPAYKLLVLNPHGERHLGRPSHRREETVETDSREIGSAGGVL
jgi:hypothetical protein